MLISSFLKGQDTIIGSSSPWKCSNVFSGDTWMVNTGETVTWQDIFLPAGYGDIKGIEFLSELEVRENSQSYYFIHEFEYFLRGNETYLILSVMVDDGAVIYLNGSELQRVRMPGGRIVESTFANGIPEEGKYANYYVPCKSLKNGNNILAAEVHQYSKRSSDMAFDFGLVVSYDPFTQEDLHIHWGSKDSPLKGLTVSWEGPGLLDSIRWGYTEKYESGAERAEYIEYSVKGLHEYTFPEVKENTIIYYQLYSSVIGKWMQPLTFLTSNALDTEKFSITLAGDSRTYMNDWRDVSLVLKKSDFTLFAGDIVEDGRKINMWNEWFVYGREYLEQNILYHTFGNHDAGPYFSKLFCMPVNNANGSELFYSFEYGSAIIICLNSTQASSKLQYNWLLKTLEDNVDKKWKIVLFHIPFYSCGGHAGEMKKYFGTWWKAFDDYGVDLIVNGHAHNFQRTLPINLNVSTDEPVKYYGSCSESGRCQVVVGGSGAPLYGVRPNKWFANAAKIHHFCTVEVDGDVLQFKAFDKKLNVFDEFTIDKSFSTSLDISVINCHGSYDGMAEAEAFRGNKPYDFRWNTGDSVRVLSNLGEGYYSVTVSDDASCKLIDDFILMEPDPLELNFQKIDESLIEAGDGSITAIVSGGTMPYKFKWNDDSSSDKLENIGKGIYSLSVTDAHNCAISGKEFIDVERDLTRVMSERVKIYPNQDNTSLILDSNDEILAYKVMRMDNRVVSEDKVGQTVSEINIEGLKAGYYLVELLTQDSRSRFPIFIK